MTLRELVPLARGAWRAAIAPASIILAAFGGGEVVSDPYNLFSNDEPAKPAAIPYNPAVMQALQDGRPIQVN